MAKKTIKIGLSATEIQKAIQEVNRIKTSLNKALESLIRELVDEGKEIAKLEIASLGAFDTGELLGSIDGYYDESKGMGVIFTDCPYAVFVEYGTGIVGANSPHPNPISGWNYDSNDHGESGWWYEKEKGSGDFRWTKGSPSKPFMYETWWQLSTRIKKIAKEKVEVVLK